MHYKYKCPLLYSYNIIGIKEYDNILYKYEEVAGLMGIELDYLEMKRRLFNRLFLILPTYTI